MKKEEYKDIGGREILFTKIIAKKREEHQQRRTFQSLDISGRDIPLKRS